MDKKVLSLVFVFIAVFALAAAFVFESSLPPTPKITEEMDFSVTGTNDCLRFLNSTVSICYIPLRTAINENWQLTINCTEMPGGVNGFVDVYIYRGYWDEGSAHKCMSKDLYPILGEIQSADSQIRLGNSFSETFGGSISQSYTVFFIFPPGGQAAFHVTYKKM